MKEFSELYNLYSKEIYKYFLYQVGNPHEAEELVQETFYQCYKSLGNFKGNSTVKTWIYSIGKNTYYKYLSKKKNNEINIENLKLSDELSSPLKCYEDKEELLNIMLKIKNLEEPYRQVIILRAINNLSFKEIGYILGKSESYGRVTFHRAKAKLGKELNYEGY